MFFRVTRRLKFDGSMKQLSEKDTSQTSSRMDGDGSRSKMGVKCPLLTGYEPLRWSDLTIENGLQQVLLPVSLDKFSYKSRSCAKSTYGLRITENDCKDGAPERFQFSLRVEYPEVRRKELQRLGV
jgi:hypothetical protein